MISFKTYSELLEAAYSGNIGIMELIKFHSKASPDQVKQLKDHIANKHNDKAWELVQHVTGTQLNKTGLK